MGAGAALNNQLAWTPSTAMTRTSRGPGRSDEAFHPRELSASTGSVGTAKLIPVFIGKRTRAWQSSMPSVASADQASKQKTADIHSRRYKKRAAMTGRPPLYLRRSSRMRAIAIAICPTSKTKTIFMDESHLTAGRHEPVTGRGRYTSSIRAGADPAFAAWHWISLQRSGAPFKYPRRRDAPLSSVAYGTKSRQATRLNAILSARGTPI